MKQASNLKIWILFAGALLVFIIAPLFGAVSIKLSEVFSVDGGAQSKLVFFDLRLPRVFFAFLAGAALSLAGLIFQAVFANFLASPFTLGVASGAAFGSALYFNLGLSFSLLGIAGSVCAGMSGALLVMLALYLLARANNRVGSTELLLAGVVLSLFFSSLIVFIQYLSDFAGILKITRWLMGGFEVAGFNSVIGLVPFVLLGLCLATYYRAELNMFSLGDELAQSRGVDVKRIKSVLLLIISMMVGAVVSFCGPISSVGIIAPHIARLIFGFDHRRLVIAAFLCGGIFVVICDTLARSIIAPYEIPVGVITALLEGPFFLWLLYRRRWRVL